MRLSSTIWSVVALHSHLRKSQKMNENSCKVGRIHSGWLAGTWNVGRFIDASIFLFARQLPNRNILPPPEPPAHIHVCVGWRGRESHPRFALNSEIVKLSTTDILGQIVLCCGGCPEYCGTFSRIYPLDASSKLLPSCDNNRYCQVSANLSHSLGAPQFKLSRQ